MNCSFISFIYIKENSVTDIITHSKSCSGENDTNLKECPVQYSEYQYGVKYMAIYVYVCVCMIEYNWR